MDAEGIGKWTLDPETQIELWVPSYTTDENTIRRAKLKRNGELRTIRFYPDSGHAWPLWEDAAGSYTTMPEDLGLSGALTQRLRQWYDIWADQRLHALSWSSAALRDAWHREGDELVVLLEMELWDIAEVHAEHRPPEP